MDLDKIDKYLEEYKIDKYLEESKGLKREREDLDRLIKSFKKIYKEFPHKNYSDVLETLEKQRVELNSSIGKKSWVDLANTWPKAIRQKY